MNNSKKKHIYQNFLQHALKFDLKVKVFSFCEAYKVIIN